MGELFVSVVASAIGMGLFLYGKRQRRPPQLIAGVGLMVYPYVVSGVLASGAVGVALLGMLWLALRVGW